MVLNESRSRAIAIPSYVPLVTRERMVLSSLDIPPDLVTYPTDPGR
jgi:hypothetical protein